MRALGGRPLFVTDPQARIGAREAELSEPEASSASEPDSLERYDAMLLAAQERHNRAQREPATIDFKRFRKLRELCLLERSVEIFAPLPDNGGNVHLRLEALREAGKPGFT